MNIILQIIIISAPLMLASTGALLSEYAGRMAIFLESVINVSAFLCFAFTTCSHSLALGIMFSMIAATVFITMYAAVTEKFHANPFLSALALNLLLNALVSVFSARIFGTRGVLTSTEYFLFSAATARIATTIGAAVLCILGMIWLFTSRSGLYIRITGSDAPFLESRGISATKYRICSWSAAALFGSAAGCIYAIRLSSFVPGVASGTGWTALAVVFLGKKNAAAVFAAALVFSAAQFAASNLQNVPGLHEVPSAVLLALPYLVPLLLILVLPGEHRGRYLNLRQK